MMVPTEMVGTDAALFTTPGTHLFDQHPGRSPRSAGRRAPRRRPGLAARYDLAMLDVFFAGMAAFLHGAALVGADEHSRPHLRPVRQADGRALLDVTLDGLATDVDAGTHDGSGDNLVMELAFLEHIVDNDREPRPGHRAAGGRAQPRGHGRRGWSRR